jgi:hypothetical protein
MKKNEVLYKLYEIYDSLEGQPVMVQPDDSHAKTRTKIMLDDLIDELEEVGKFQKD